MIEVEDIKGRHRVFDSFIEKEQVNTLENIQFPGEIVIVENPEDESLALDEIEQLPYFGFDTESRPAFKKGVTNPVALIQISTLEKAWIFRLGPLGFSPRWKSIFENPKVLKIGVAIADDFRDLKKFSSFQQKGVVDFYKVAPKLGFKCNGLRRLSALVLGKKVSKSYQVSKWDLALSSGQIMYAATDAYVPLVLWKELCANFDNPELHGL